ncbi:sterile alpha motif domain-containing protein 7 [Perognathus longimembris pacificus]|uniref:sterile alpha motif domain-containing protein 7 n=1 Tax=Perognathus longimembris pacificus TaxID=214514 RepID=UPI0020196C70|nr:sterile alpha motif domain-containing protein 7 [Perognathus longimembris pacificus]
MASLEMAVNPFLTASGSPQTPLVPSPFGLPTVDRDVLSSTIASPDPRQFCVPSQFSSSVLPNANMPHLLSSCVYSGWSILPPDSIKAVTRRNEIIQRHPIARDEMEMYAIYQQRRMEKVNPKRLAGLGAPCLYGPSGPAPYHGRTMLPARDLHFHRSAMRRNPMLVATRPHFIESWEQKCQLRRGAGHPKPLGSHTENSKSQAEENILVQTHAIPSEQEEYEKEPETELFPDEKSGETNGKPTTAGDCHCGVDQPGLGKPWGGPTMLLHTKAMDGGENKPSEQGLEAYTEKDGICAPISHLSLPGAHTLTTSGENLSLDEDIQTWTVDDVHNFISNLPGCSDYAQVFKDHAIDGETLPLLTEAHLRSTLGLKLGPALKIQSQVSQHVGSTLLKKMPSFPIHRRQACAQPADPSPPVDFNSWNDTLSTPSPQDTMLPKRIERDNMRS